MNIKFLRKASLSLLLITSVIDGEAYSSDNLAKACDEDLFKTCLVKTFSDKVAEIRLRYAQNHVKTHKEDPNERVRLGSLDGGGLRGLIFLPQLRALELLTGKPIHELFDIIGGTSTGGISAIALSYMDATGCVASPKDLINLYLKCGREIFRYRPSALKAVSTFMGAKHTADGLETVIKKLVGDESFKANNFKIPVLITSVNANQRKLKIFSTMHKNDSAIQVWKIARATSAAQSFFPPININDIAYIDGGHMSNCPASDFMDFYVTNMSSSKTFSGNNKLSIFSFGTGDVSLMHETNSIFDEYILGKVESSIECLFTAQERNANRNIEREVELFHTCSALLTTLKEQREQTTQVTELGDLSKGHTEHFLNLVKKAAPQLEEQAGFQNHLRFNTHVTKRFDQQRQILESLRPKIEKATQDMERHSWVQSHYRSQTEPLPKHLHEMDDVSKGPELFNEGLKMLKSTAFKNILRGIFGAEFEISDEILNAVSQEIREEAELIDIKDVRPFTMLSIITDFLTKRDLNLENVREYFSRRLPNTDKTTVSELPADKLREMLKWVDALLAANEEHQSDRSFFSKLKPGGGHVELSQLIDEMKILITKYLANK